MDSARVVELWAPGVKQVGSGYLLTDRLVLTAYHVVRGLACGDRVEVRPLEVSQRTGWLTATLCWPSEAVDIGAFPEHDAALLVLDAPPGEPGPLVGTVRFGQVTGQDRIPCQGLGFPDAEKRPGNRRDTMPVRGHLDALQARKSGLLTVHVDEGIVPRRLSSGSGWAGASGTALFCGSLLVGVLATDRSIADDASVLSAVPITALADLPAFCDILTAHHVDLRLEHASPSAQHLSHYLAAAYRAATDHPYASFLPGSTPPLAAVYLRQQIRRLNHKKTDDREANTTPVAGTADDILADPPTCVIISGPGGGKSSLLRTRLADGVKRWQDGHNEGLLPVLVDGAELAEHTLAEALTAAGSNLGLVDKLPEAFFSNPPRPGARWLVLLDGLDEVADPAQRKKILDKVTVATTGEHTHLYRFIIATRPLPDRGLDILGPEIPQYDLHPFNPADLETVARGWFRAASLPDPEDTAQRFVETLRTSRLAELARVPLMTAMLCQLHISAPDQNLPDNRGQIYRNFVALLRKSQPTAPGARYPGLERNPEAHTDAEATLAHLYDLIAHLAAERQAGNTLPALTVLQSQPAARCPKDVTAADWHTFLDTALRRSGVLTARAGDLVFLHQTLQEHIAARLLMSDPCSRHRTLHDVLPRPLKYRPTTRGTLWNGVRLSIWRMNNRGARDWATPPHSEDLSYVGFLIDAAHHEDPEVADPYLHRLIQGGLPGLRALATLHQLRTTIAGKTLQTTKDQLHALAVDYKLNNGPRLDAARALAELGDPRGVDALHTLAQGFSADATDAVWALGKLGDPRGADTLRTLALDTRLNSGTRADAVWELVRIGDPGGADALHTLALDTRFKTGLDTRRNDKTRLKAARELAGIGDPRGADTLHTLALDTHLIYQGYARLEAAKALAGLGDPRGADTLHTLALDPRLNGRPAAKAAEALAGLGDPRGAATLHTLARGSADAVWALAGLGDPRRADALHTLAVDPHLNDGPRVAAAKALAGLGDPRGADALHTLAFDLGLYYSSRVAAAKALAGLGDPRGADALHTLALDPRLNGGPRVAAAKALAGLGDPRGADALHTLALAPRLDGTLRVAAAEALALLVARTPNNRTGRVHPSVEQITKRAPLRRRR